MTKLQDHIDGLWDGLVRQLDATNIEEMAIDSKVKTSTGKLYFYVPQPYLSCAQLMFKDKVEVQEYKPDLQEPGLLSLGWHNNKPLPYCVPGGRFNEMYGWDSYFIILGLLKSDRVQLARAMMLNQCFEIDYYGKILNANRSYYLNRSQPPFLTDMALQIYAYDGDKELLEVAIDHAIKEYTQVWMQEPRLHSCGLSRYRPPSIGRIPLEVEAGHFNEILEPLAEQHNLSIEEFTTKYNAHSVKCPELDAYLQHDLGVRESGHDTSSRLHEVCADLATIDLNCLLFKYESDIANALTVLGRDGSQEWVEKADKRKALVMKFMWCEEDYMFYDYNTEAQQQHKFPAPTCLWVLWSQLCPPDIAVKLVPKALELFEHNGGLAGSTPLKTHRQWDYPSGWAPHQIMAWKGLKNYGFDEDAFRLSSKWISTVTQVWETEGLIFEKYNVVDCTHGVDAEYGNQGTFNEGFGWTNASILVAKEYELLAQTVQVSSSD